MRIAVLGTGVVGQTLARKLVELGHDVVMGSRTADNPAASAFADETGAGHGTFAKAARSAELVVVATNGAGTLDALETAGDLDEKVIVDVSNPLDFANGFPPTLIPALANTTSLGEEIQKRYPRARVVKTLNTVNCYVMVDPGRLKEPGDIFVSGDDPDAKAVVVGILKDFGWKEPVDLGDISTARGPELYVAFWVRLMGTMGDADFNIKLVR